MSSSVATVAVACSGGRDSIALLYATLCAAKPLGLRVAALHVHHGLMPQADAWAADLCAWCEQWRQQGWPITFAQTTLTARPMVGESVEAWARRERYAALSRMATDLGATLVLLAHHRRDQAETVLLQALRGAGPAGLAAMPALIVRDGMTYARPWLERPSCAIDAYVAHHHLPYVSDPSNADPRYARSRLRTRVLPVLNQAFADAEAALCTLARHAHSARQVLDEVAAADLAMLGAGAELPLAGWRALSSPRRLNALRTWLARGLGHAAPETLVQRLLRETDNDATRHWPASPSRALQSSKGRLFWGRAHGATRGGGQAVGGLSFSACGCFPVPGWRGWLEIFPVALQGLSPPHLLAVIARPRDAGVQFQAGPQRPARSLKKQFQAAGLGPESRVGPLLYDALGALLYVPGLGVDARVWAPVGTPQWGLQWCDEQASDNAD